MDEDRKFRIRVLGELCEKLRQKVENFRAVNVAGMDFDGRMRLAGDYAVAVAEMNEAEAALRKAQEPTP